MAEHQIRLDLAARILTTFRDHGDTRRADTLQRALSHATPASSHGGVMEASPASATTPRASSPEARPARGRGRGKGGGRGETHTASPPTVSPKDATPRSSLFLSCFRPCGFQAMGCTNSGLIMGHSWLPFSFGDSVWGMFILGLGQLGYRY